ncbi:hypothetical protein J4436_01805 [Candidatus Woesearchaeota archaeon]|nr:hypothetical protein [Candidatus Woesearchaeota archaeon]
MIQKKGISPLIATVLIVGFVIVLAVVFWVFLREEVAKRIEKSKATDLAKVTCAQSVGISASECSFVSNKLKFSVEGIKDKILVGVRVRFYSDGTADTLLHEQQIDKGDKVNIALDLPGVSAVDSIEVIPVIMEGGWELTCPDQLVKITCS